MKRPPAVRPAEGQNALLTRHALGGDGPVLSWSITDPASGGGQRRIGSHQPTEATICAEDTGGNFFLWPKAILMTEDLASHVPTIRGNPVTVVYNSPCGFPQVACSEVETLPRKVDDLINFTFGNDERRRQNHRVANRAHHESVGEAVIPALRAHIDSAIKELPIRFVVHQFNRTEQAAAAHFAYKGMLGEFANLRLEVGADIRIDSLDELLALDDLQVL